MTSDLSHLNYSHRFGVRQLFGMLMCVCVFFFPFSSPRTVNQLDISACTPLSRRMNGWNDQEQQCNGARAVVCCDVINSLASVTHNGRPQRCAVPPKAWDSGMLLRNLSFSSFISPQSASLSASVPRPNSDTVRTPTQEKKTKKPTRSHESIGVDRCQESDTSFYFSLVMYLSLLCFFFFFFPRENDLLPPGWILRRVSLPPRCLYRPGPLIEY